MNSPNWLALSGVDPKLLTKARLETHYAMQWLARAARAYVPEMPADSHTNLGWDETLAAFTTHPLPDGTMLVLRIEDTALALASAGRIDAAHTFVLDGRREAEVREWLGRAVAARSLDPKGLDAPLRWTMPEWPVASGAPYATGGLADALRELAAWNANAYRTLVAFQQDLVASGFNASPVRMWPHHYDFDTLVELGGGRSTGIGFSPGDHFYDEPYFYVSLNPKPDIAKLPPLTGIGRWNTTKFVAPVATAERIIAAEDPKGAVEAYLREAIDIANAPRG